MPEMNRVTAGHGTGSNPFAKIGEKVSGRLNAMHQGIQSAVSQQADHEHEINKMVVGHVLAKDMVNHLAKHSADQTEISMDHGNISTTFTRRPRNVRGAAATTPEAHVETPASTPNAAESESTSREASHSGNTTFVGATIPTNPGEWAGGFMEHNPKTGRAQTKPGYKEFKTRKQHFQAGLASQQGHFALKPGVKVPAYARKAMQPKKGK